MVYFTRWAMRAFALIAFSLGLSTLALSATRTATTTGNWNATATWGGNPVPVAGDVANIPNAVTVTVTVTLAGGTIPDQITISNGTLTVSTGITLAVGNAGIQQTGGTISGAGAITIAGGGYSLATAGTLSNTGGFTVTAGGFAMSAGTLSGAGAITINGGNFAYAGGTSTGYSGTLNVNNGGNINVTAGTFGPTGTVNTATTGAINVSGTGTYGGSAATNPGGVSVTAGTYSSTGALTISTNGFSISAGTANGAGTTLITGGLSITGTGVYSRTGTHTINTGGITHSSSGTSIPTNTIGVTAGGISVSAGVFNPTGAVTITAGGLIITGGAYTGPANLTVTAGGLALSNAGAYNQASNNTTSITGNVSVSNTAVYNQSATGSTVTINGSFTSTSTTQQVLKSSMTVNNGNFSFTGVTQTAANMPPTLTINAVTGGVTLAGGPTSGAIVNNLNNLTVAATSTQLITISGQVAVAAASTTTFSTGSTSNYSISALSSLNTGGTWNWNAGNVTLVNSGSAVLQSNGVSPSGAAGSVTLNNNQWFIAGSWSTNGSLVAGTGRVVYNGSGAQTARAVDYYNLRFTNTGTKTFGARAGGADTTETINNDFTVNFGSGMGGAGTNMNKIAVGGDIRDSGTFTFGAVRVVSVGGKLQFGSNSSQSPSVTPGTTLKYLTITGNFENSSTTAFAPGNTQSFVMSVGANWYGNAFTATTAPTTIISIAGNLYLGGIINLLGSTVTSRINLTVTGTTNTYQSAGAPAFPSAPSFFLSNGGGITTSASPNVVRILFNGNVDHSSNGTMGSSANVAEYTFNSSLTGSIGGFGFAKSRVTFTGGNISVRPATYMRLKMTTAGTKTFLPASGTLLVNGLQLTANQVFDLSNNQALTLSFIAPALLGGGSGTLTLKGASSAAATTTNQIITFADTVTTSANAVSVQGPVGTVYFDATNNYFYQAKFTKLYYNSGGAAQVTAGYSLLAPDVTIGSSVNFGNGTLAPTYQFNGTAQKFKVRIPAGVTFNQIRNDGTNTSINTDASSTAFSRDRTFVVSPTGYFTVSPPSFTATNYRLNVAYDYKSSGSPGESNLAAGSITVSSGSTAVTVNNPASGNADANSNFNVGDELITDAGAVIGVVTAIPSANSLTIATGSPLTYTNQRVRISNTFRPISFTPTATGTGTVSISFLKNLSSGISNQSVPDAGNKRSNYIVNIVANGTFPASNINFDANITSDQGDFNANLLPGNVSFYQYANSVWNKYRGNGAALTSGATYPGTPSASGNYTILSNGIPLAGNNNYIYGQYVAGGALQTDPLYTWVGGFSGNSWTDYHNWTRSPGLVATSYPNATNQNVLITGTGAGPVLNAADSVSVNTIDQSGRQLTINGVLRIYGNWNLNQPAITDAGDGAISITGSAMTGVGTSFNAATGSQTSALGVGTLIYADDRTVYGIIASVNSATSATMATVAGLALPAIASQSFLYRNQTFAAGPGTISRATTTTNVITGVGTNFTDSYRGRVIIDNTGAYVGTVLVVESPTQLRVIEANATILSGVTYSISNPLGSVGTGSFVAGPTSKVSLLSNTNNQAIPAGTYNDLFLDDSRLFGSNTIPFLLKGPNQQGGDVIINRQYRVRGGETLLTLFGPRLIMNDGSTICVYWPSDQTATNKPANTRVFTSFDQYGGTNPFSLQLKKTSVGVNLYLAAYATGYGANTPIDGPLGGSNYLNLNNFTLVGGNGSTGWNTPNGSSVVVNGNLSLLNATGGVNGTRLQMGNNPSESFLTLNGDYINPTGNTLNFTNNIGFALNGSGAMTTDITPTIAGASHVTRYRLNRPGYSGTLGVDVDSVQVYAGNLTLSKAALNITGSLKMLGGKLIFPTASQTIALQGNLDVTNGSIVPSNTSTFSLTGTNVQSISGAPVVYGGVTNTDSTRFWNFTLNKTGGSVSVDGSGRINIYNTFSVSGTNTATMTTNTGVINFRSKGPGAGQTARVAVLGASAFSQLAGNNWRVERNMPATPGWYFAAPNVTGKTFADIEVFQARTTPANNANVYYHQENDTTTMLINGTRLGGNGWHPVAALSNALTPGSAYRMYAGSTFTSTQHQYAVTGGMVTGNSITKAVTYTPAYNNPPKYTSVGYNLLGNPYASEISFAALKGLGGQNGFFNSYVAWNGALSRYQYYASSGNPLGTTAVAGGTDVIASGQSFFIKTTTAGNVIFNETIKTSSTTNGAFIRQGVDEPQPNKLWIKLTNAAGYDDDAVIGFANGLSMDDQDEADMAKFRNTHINLSSVPMPGIRLAINGMPMPNRDVMIPLRIESATGGAMKFAFTGVAAFNGLQAYLLDRATNTTTPITEGMAYSFSMSPALAANPEGGYAIVFRPTSVTATAELLNAPRLSIYPNPASGTAAHISVLNATVTKATLNVLDLSGKVIATQQMSGNTTTLSGLPAGAYQIVVSTDKGTYRDRLVVE